MFYRFTSSIDYPCLEIIEYYSCYPPLSTSIYEARERGNTVTTGQERTSTMSQAPAIKLKGMTVDKSWFSLHFLLILIDRQLGPNKNRTRVRREGLQMTSAARYIL